MTRLEENGRDSDGGRRWALKLGPVEATIVTELPDRLERILTHPTANKSIVDRLFPRCYEDEQDEQDSRRLLGASLMEERRETVDAVRAQVLGGVRASGGLELDMGRADLDLWLRFVNDMRLVLATDLGIEENIDHSHVDWASPEAPKHALLEYLGGLEMLLLEGLGACD